MAARKLSALLSYRATNPLACNRPFDQIAIAIALQEGAEGKTFAEIAL